ncbi:MAG: START-like domain-containing protein [Flavobacteriales bacterium]
MSEKVKYQLEFVVKSSPSLLFSYISTPSGLGQWFADNVNSRGELFTFMWDGSEEQAKLLSKKTNQSIKFQWLSEDDDCYFELRIQIDDLTQDVALIITDFAYEDELDEAKLLWETQVSDLHAIIG